MVLIEFSLNNSLYLLLLGLSGFGQIKMFEELDGIPQFIFMFFESLSLLLFVIFEDISLMITKRFRPRINSIKKLNLLLNASKIVVIKAREWVKYKIAKMFLSVFLLGILTTLNNMACIYIYYSFMSKINGMFCFANFLATWLMLKIWSYSTIHLHHVVALSILFIGLIASFILNYDLISMFIMMVNGSMGLLIGYFFGIVFIQSSREVLEKYALDVLKIKHFKLLFFEGFSSMFINIICLIIFQLAQCNSENDERNIFLMICGSAQFKELMKRAYDLLNYSSIHSLYVAIYVISTIIVHCSRILINKTSGPTHRYSADLLAFEMYMIYDSLNKVIKGFDIQLFEWDSYVLILILVIGCLIYNENIRINIGELSTNTRVEIEKRAQIENQLIESSLQDLRIFDDENQAELSIDEGV